MKFAVRAAVVVFPLTIIITFLWYLHTGMHMSAAQIAQMKGNSGRRNNTPLPMVLIEFGLFGGMSTYALVLGGYALLRRNQAKEKIRIASRADPAWDILDREREVFEAVIRAVIDNANTYDIEAIRPILTARHAEETSNYYRKMRTKNIRISNSSPEIKSIDVTVTQDHKDDTKDRIGLRVVLRYKHEWRSMKNNAVIFENTNPRAYFNTLWWFRRDNDCWLLDGESSESLDLYETEQSFVES